jgi:hypothetical protein
MTRAHDDMPVTLTLASITGDARQVYSANDNVECSGNELSMHDDLAKTKRL